MKSNLVFTFFKRAVFGVFLVVNGAFAASLSDSAGLLPMSFFLTQEAAYQPDFALQKGVESEFEPTIGSLYHTSSLKNGVKFRAQFSELGGRGGFEWFEYAASAVFSNARVKFNDRVEEEERLAGGALGGGVRGQGGEFFGVRVFGAKSSLKLENHAANGKLSQEFFGVLAGVSKRFEIAHDRDTTLFLQGFYIRGGEADLQTSQGVVKVGKSHNVKTEFGVKLRKDLTPNWQSFWRFGGEYNFGFEANSVLTNAVTREFSEEFSGFSYLAKLGFAYRKNGVSFGVSAEFVEGKRRAANIAASVGVGF